MPLLGRNPSLCVLLTAIEEYCVWPSALSPVPNIKPSYTGCSCLLKTLNIKDRRDTPSAITHHATRTLCKTTWMERKTSSKVHNSPWLHSIFSPTPFVFDFLFLRLNYRIDVNVISLKQRRLLMRNSVWSVKTLQSHSKMTHVVSWQCRRLTVYCVFSRQRDHNTELQQSSCGSICFVLFFYSWGWTSLSDAFDAPASHWLLGVVAVATLGSYDRRLIRAPSHLHPSLHKLLCTTEATDKMHLIGFVSL